jgi:protein-tyrosine phosphatase
LETRGIKTIVDFRGEKEKQEAPDRAVGTVDTTIELPIEAGNILELFATGAEVQGEVLMRELYSRMVESARPQYRTFFTILAEGGHTPLLFHCSAGKDRTGLAAAFILSALGVDRDRVYQDYLLSAEYLKPVIRQWIAAEPHLEAVMTIRREYLEAAFTRIDTDFGGIERYITEELKADVARLRSCYTEAVGV